MPAPLMAIVTFLFWRLPQAILRYLAFQQRDVVRMRHDASLDRYLHLFIEHTLARRQGGSRKAFQHVLLDLDTYRVRSGPRQVGDKLDLDSPFVQRSLVRASQRVGHQLALGRGVGHKGVTINVPHVEAFGDVRPGQGRHLCVQSVAESGSADSMSMTRVWLRYFVERELRWSKQGTDAWLGPEKCFLVAGDRLCILYDDAVDTRLLVLQAQTGAVLADRYLLGVI